MKNDFDEIYEKLSPRKLIKLQLIFCLPLFSPLENPCILKQAYCRYLTVNNPDYLERYEVMHAGTCDGSDPTKTVAVSYFLDLILPFRIHPCK